MRTCVSYSSSGERGASLIVVLGVTTAIGLMLTFSHRRVWSLLQTIHHLENSFRNRDAVFSQVVEKSNLAVSEQLLAAPFGPHPRLVVGDSITGGHTLGIRFSERLNQETGIVEPDWQALAQLSALPCLRWTREQMPVGGWSQNTCSSFSPSLHGSRFLSGNLETQELHISISNSDIEYLAFIGSVRVGTLSVRAEKPATLYLLATGDVFLDSLEQRGGSAIHLFIHSSFGAVQNLTPKTPGSICDPNNQKYPIVLSLSASKEIWWAGRNLGANRLLGCPISPGGEFWPIRIVTGILDY